VDTVPNPVVAGVFLLSLTVGRDTPLRLLENGRHDISAPYRYNEPPRDNDRRASGALGLPCVRMTDIESAALRFVITLTALSVNYHQLFDIPYTRRSTPLQLVDLPYGICE